MLYGLYLFNIISFSVDFIITLVIMGSIGTGINMIKYSYPKNTLRNNQIRFIIAIYSGLYLFYFFGGFELGFELGNFHIETEQANILLGVKIIAWLLLLGTFFKSSQYLIKIIQLYKKNTRIEIKKKKVSKYLRIGSIFANLILIFYIFSLIISGSLILPKLYDIDPINDLDYNNNGTYFDAYDDKLNITIHFDFNNRGVYAIKNVKLKLEICTLSTDNSLILPENTKVGETSQIHYNEFPAFSEIINQQMIIMIDTLYVPGLVLTDAVLQLKIIFSGTFGGIYIDFTFCYQTEWNSLI